VTEIGLPALGYPARSVPFRALGEVCTVLNGFAFKSDQFNSGGEGLPLIRIRDVNTGFSGTYYSGKYDVRYRVETGDLLIGMDGEFRAIRWSHGPALLNQRVCRLHSFVPEVDPGFIRYAVQQVLDRIQEATQGSTVKHLSSRELERSLIPVPPLEVQREIVRVLDSFSSAEAALGFELEAEAAARAVQVADIKRRVIAGIHADQVPLSSLGRWMGGMTPSKSAPRYWEAGTIPWLASMDVTDVSSTDIRGRITAAAIKETSLRVAPAPSVAVVMRSNILRRVLPVRLIEVDTTVNQDIRLLVPSEGIDADYVAQVLRTLSDDFRAASVRTDGSMAAVDAKVFFNLSVPLPKIERQRQVAAELRELDSAFDQLSSALPAELAARRKQYEYYRDKLLTFKELES
jgi:type I restriction enzyme S subunit